MKAKKEVYNYLHEVHGFALAPSEIKEIVDIVLQNEVPDILDSIQTELLNTSNLTSGAVAQIATFGTPFLLKCPVVKKEDIKRVFEKHLNQILGIDKSN